MAGCVFGYFADCTVVMPLFLRIANAFVPKCGRRNAEVQVMCMGVVTGGDVQGRHHRSGIVTGLALSDEPTFHNVFRLTVKTEVGQKIRSHFINKQTSSFWPLSSLTWCGALLLHKIVFRICAFETNYN